MNNVYVLQCSRKKFKEYHFEEDEVRNFTPKVKKVIKTLPVEGGIESLIDFLGESLGPAIDVSKDKNPHCPSCNMDLFTVSETGIFGCDDCFSTFEDSLKDKFPEEYAFYASRVEKEEKINEKNKKEVQALREKIEELIAEEKYEDIAKIRNELQRIEKGESSAM